MALAVFVGLLLMACGDASQTDDSGASSDSPMLTPLQQAASDVLSERLSVASSDLALVSDEMVEWADASLGCPEAGMMYAQAITPGHRITFDYQGNQYEVHTSREDGSATQPLMVSCEGGVSY